MSSLTLPQNRTEPPPISPFMTNPGRGAPPSQTRSGPLCSRTRCCKPERGTEPTPNPPHPNHPPLSIVVPQNQNQSMSDVNPRVPLQPPTPLPGAGTRGRSRGGGADSTEPPLTPSPLSPPSCHRPTAALTSGGGSNRIPRSSHVRTPPLPLRPHEPSPLLRVSPSSPPTPQ